MGESSADSAAPLPNTYWVEPGRLLAGEYPGSPSRADTMDRLRRLIDAGITYFIDLTEPGELLPYDLMLPTDKTASGRYVMYARKPIPDHSVPPVAEAMKEIIEYIDRALAAGHLVYVHCRAGIGRTGTVMGCYLVNRGLAPDDALARLNELWRANERAKLWPQTPETDEQLEFVRAWTRPPQAARVELAPPALGAARSLRDRFQGALLGLAVGDALGCAVQHRKPGTFTPLGDLIGGGPFELPRGAWSDDTALALCLAESLLESNGADPVDQMHRYQRWQREGYLSSTGQCVGITASVSRALAAAQWSGKAHSGSHDPARLDKEALSRVAAAVLFHFADPAAAIAEAAEAARTTHQAPVVLDACRYLGALLVGALQGTPKTQLLAPLYSPVEGLWDRRPLKAPIEAIAAGSFRTKSPPEIEGGGTIVQTLEAVLWAFDCSRDFREGALLAVNLGLDADVTGAVYGQLAGAAYGAAGIPAGWRAAVYERERIEEFADRLLTVALEHMAV